MKSHTLRALRIAASNLGRSATARQLNAALNSTSAARSTSRRLRPPWAIFSDRFICYARACSKDCVGSAWLYSVFMCIPVIYTWRQFMDSDLGWFSSLAGVSSHFAEFLCWRMFGHFQQVSCPSRTGGKLFQAVLIENYIAGQHFLARKSRKRPSRGFNTLHTGVY